MKKSESIKEIAAALSKFQSALKGAEKGGTNPHFKSKYSTFEDVWTSIRQPLGENGLSIIQELSTKDNAISVITLLLHSTGEWIEFSPFDVPLSAKNAHAVGSASSYAKRYSLCAAMGIVSASDDDDGNGAVASADAAKNHPEPIEYISNDEAMTIENFMAGEPDGSKYRSDILSFFSNLEKISPPLNDFFKMPKRRLLPIMNSIAKKKLEREKAKAQVVEQYEDF